MRGLSDVVASLSVAELRGKNKAIFGEAPADKAIALGVEASYAIDGAKAKVHGRQSIPLDQQRLVPAGEHLEGGRTSSIYDVQEESAWHSVLPLRGGTQVFVEAPKQAEGAHGRSAMMTIIRELFHSLKRGPYVPRRGALHLGGAAARYSRGRGTQAAVRAAQGRCRGQPHRRAK